HPRRRHWRHPRTAALALASDPVTIKENLMAINLPGPPAPVYLFDDEFDGSAGSPPDPAKWVFDIGGPGAFGNKELETYTDDTANCYQDGSSNLVIRALSGSGGYTSARIKTLGKFAVYGGTWEA